MKNRIFKVLLVIVVVFVVGYVSVNQMLNEMEITFSEDRRFEYDVKGYLVGENIYVFVDYNDYKENEYSHLGKVIYNGEIPIVPELNGNQATNGKHEYKVLRSTEVVELVIYVHLNSLEVKTGLFEFRETQIFGNKFVILEFERLQKK